MTAKKMADIFFGKFSELESIKDSSNSEQISEKKIDQTIEVKSKKQNQKKTTPKKTPNNKKKKKKKNRPPPPRKFQKRQVAIAIFLGR